MADDPLTARDPAEVFASPESADAWVEGVLDRLQPESRGRLLGLEKGTLRFAYNALRTQAREVIFALDLGEEELREILGHDPATASAAFEDTGKHAYAAAFYATMHDLFAPESGGALEAFLRIKIGLCLHQLKDDRRNAERCVGVLLPALENMGALPASSADLAELRFLLYQALGLRLAQLEDYECAVDFLTRAMDEASTADLRIGALCSMVSCLASAGELQVAYRKLQAERALLTEVTDPEIVESFRTLEADLHQRLGLRVANPGAGLPFGLARTARAFESWLERGERPDGFTLGEVRRGFEEMAAQEAREAPEGARGRHSLLLGRLLSISPSVEPEAWDATLREAEELEARFAEEAPKLERKVLAARLRAFQGNHVEATAGFEALWPDVQRHLALSAQLDVAARFVEALARCGAQPGATSLASLVDFIERALAREIAAQPTAPARARARDANQRPIESALLALLTGAERAGFRTAEGQGLLARVWDLVEAVRNPELRTGCPAIPAELRAEHRRLEDEFHRGLREYLLAMGKGPDLRGALQRLLEFEISWLGPPPDTPGAERRLEADPRTLLCLFELRDLLAKKMLLVLRSSPEGLEGRPVPLESERMKALDAWCAELPRFPPRPAAAEEPARELARLLLGGGDPGPAVELSLDGALHAKPIEALPDPWRLGERLGAARAVEIRLRSGRGEPPRPVDLTRGWLGFGGIPEAKGCRYLAGSVREVESIAAKLQVRGVATSRWIGARACATVLRERLAADRPSVLHLSAHGFAHAVDPERSALVLAPDSENPAGELLPFRQILALDAGGLELVVLSACSSLAGRADRSGGMQGLAWAFLKAGARAVLASRYPVGDDATCELMTSFYEFLPDLPPAEALRRARGYLLAAGGTPEGAGAWALWT